MAERRPRYRTGDDDLDARVEELLADAGVDSNQDLAFELMTSVLRMAKEGLSRGDLKIANSTLKEMRYAFHVFDPYRSVRKLAIFGSARTGIDEPAYGAARAVGRAIADEGWMVITGGGPGIMTAGIEGAGTENSFAVNIVLPFEPAGGGVMVNDGKVINFKYFFNRKLTFMKEASAYVMFPGGYGTMDETFELLTLLQTGREVPAPIVLFEPEGDAYWRSFRHFLEVELLDSRLIRRDDLDLFHITSDVGDAIEHLTRFYRVFDSIRYVGGRLVLRLRKEPTDEQLAQLNEQFSDIVASGEIERTEPAPVEIADGDALSMHRIRFRFINNEYARLHAMIRVINTF
ncbi:LOG family protein [Dermatobacter hominis]|uniref:LOG family protein n=1 Tax=Dermatobacter hominis TaxID=2884263 RepID=UPI001D11336F|nr:TIGR00730 family Rossman fold protein [Dermatobacter hominis]UDY36420.1 TIGR00730 family Rossman fold protein [Dermatobacter hominis]